MSNVVCLMNVEADRATFTWAEGPASFEPYTLDGMVYKDLKEIAAEAREKLADLVKDFLFDEQNMPKSAFALADAGHELYLAMFQPSAEQAQQARQVRRWLEELAQQREVDTLEIVVESPWSLPLNIVYDQKPDQEAFLSGDDSPDRWKPFWGLRYNLAGGRKVDPLRRMPLLKAPKVLMVVDPEIRDGLPPEQQQRLNDFAESHEFKMVHSKDALQEAITVERPELLYWLSHAEPDALVLAGEPISPRNMRKLLRQDDDADFGGLAFLNACQTAEGGQAGSFFEAFHSVGFAGMIGTEQQTIDQFANPLGLDFLEAFLDRGEAVGSALRKLRGRVPLGLLYGTYCPPDIRVDQGSIRDSVKISQVHVPGVALSTGRAADDTAARTLPPLPREPYRSLTYYDREDRSLFAGRDDDIERFATYLDDASTRILVLHGESGVGKSSFLRAGVIPYLEEECLGYRFIREREADEAAGAQGSVIFIRATNDLYGQLAQALCEFCARPYGYQTPQGEQVSADLPGVLRELVADEVNQAIVRVVLRSDPSLLGRIMAAINDRLPFSAILVIDQGEEVFTLAQTPEDQQRGRQALDMLRRTVGAAGDFKVIFCLRTEYYGRVIDRLRRGLHDTGSIREYLLTDFDEDALLEAIRRPTADKPIPYTSDVPFEKYGFLYAGGVAEEISHRVVRYTTQRRDSVLPLMQVICAQLYGLAQRRADKTITLADLETLGGIEGGMRNHVDGLLGELLKGRPLDKKPVQKLFTQLYLKQPDGTLTTALLAEDEFQKRWTGRMPFGELLESCRKLRLLKVNSLRIGMEEQRRYISLGHDALAKLAADWDEQLSRGARMRKMATAIVLVSAVGLVMTLLAIWAVIERAQARVSEGKAVVAQREIERTLAHNLLERLQSVPDRFGRNEFRGFWQIATLPPEQERLRTLMLSIGLENDDDASRLSNRAPYVAQAVVGLDSTRRETLLNELIKPALKPTTASRSVRLACVRLGIALKLEDAEFAEQAVSVLSTSLVQTTDAGLHDMLADDLEVAVRLFPTDDSERAVIPIIEAMQLTEDAHVLRLLCNAVEAAPGEITGSQGREIADRLLTLMEQEERADVIHNLSDRLASLPADLDIVDANRAVQYLVQKITETGNPEIHESLVKAFEPIAARLRTSECRQAADTIISAMSKPVAESEGSESVQVYARCLIAVATRVAQSDAAQGIEMLLTAMQTTREADPLRTLSAGLSQLPGELAERDRREAISRLLEVMEGAKSSRTLRVLAESLALFSGALSEDDLAQATAKLLSEMRADGLPSDLAEVSKGLAALPGSLAPRDCLPPVNMLIGRLELATNQRMVRFFSAALNMLAGKMTPAAAEAAAEPILAAMTNSRDAEKILALVQVVRGMDREGKPLLSAATVEKAYQIVLAKIRDSQFAKPIDLDLLAESLAELPGDTPETAANEAIQRLLATLESTENLDAVGILMDGLGAVGGDLSADVGHQAVRQIVEKINVTGDTALWRALTLGLAAVSIELKRVEKFPDADASDVVSNLAWAMDVTTDNATLRRLAEALALIAPQLPPEPDEATRTAVHQILASMQSTNDPAVIGALAHGWEVLATRMTELEARDAYQQFLTEVEDPTNAAARPSLTQAAVAMAASSGSSQVMHALDCLLSALHNDHGPKVLDIFLGGIEKLAPRVASSDVDQAKARIIAVTTEATRLNDQVMNGLIRALDGLPGEIETRELVELLKSPFCTGAARQSLLKMIETQTKLHFDGNPWKLVAMAKEAGLDPDIFRQPVQRPKGVVPMEGSSEE